MEKVAQQAGRAAPAVAIAGVLVAAPQASHVLAGATKSDTPATGSHLATAAKADPAAKAQHTTGHAATLDSVQTHAVTVAGSKQARHAAATSITYHVRSGDTLSKIASRFFHSNDWQYLYHVNDKTISNPDQIYVGQKLSIPASAPAHYALSNYVPRHAKTAPTTSAWPSHDGSGSTMRSSGSTMRSSGAAVVTQAAPVTAPVTARQGSYSCSGLEQLWERAGGSAGKAAMAASIAMAESGGNPNAISPTADYGLWQINASNGALATLSPSLNAKSAVTLSDNGTNWGPWTTFRTGAYAGRC